MLHAPGRDPPSDRVRVWEGGRGRGFGRGFGGGGGGDGGGGGGGVKEIA